MPGQRAKGQPRPCAHRAEARIQLLPMDVHRPLSSERGASSCRLLLLHPILLSGQKQA